VVVYVIQPSLYAVEVNGARVYLTRKEYQMMELLSLRKGTATHSFMRAADSATKRPISTGQTP
jgi:hypothetical protein